MGKKGDVRVGKENEEKEGRNLLGFPTFVEFGSGRFKCVETGHELPEHAKQSYGQTKHCRLGLIDAALSKNKPPLNMFQQHPQSRSKLICRLTGDTINKTEEHIWKHINGKRFLNMLEKKETEKLVPNGNLSEETEPKETSNKKKKKKQKQKEDASKIISEDRNSTDKDHDSEEADFWMPPIGDRWDHDDGGNRCNSETEEANKEGGNMEDARELSKRTKRMSIEIGSSSSASRKKIKKN